MIQTVALAALHAHIEISTNDSRLGHLIHEMWEPLVTDRSGKKTDCVVAIEKTADVWRADFPTLPRLVTSDIWKLLLHIRIAIVHAALIASPSFLGLHAAVVSRGNTTVLLAGRSGAGKSTTTLRLLQRGWSYLGDDLAPIDSDTGCLMGFPKPLHIKDARLFSEAANLWEVPKWVPPPKYSTLIPASIFDVSSTPCARPTHLFLLDSPPGKPRRLTHFTPAFATAQSAEHLLKLDQLTPRFLRIVARLTRQTTNFGAAARSAPEMADLVEEATSN